MCSTLPSGRKTKHLSTAYGPMANVAASPTSEVAARLPLSGGHGHLNQVVPLLFNYGSAVGLVVLNKSVS